MKPIRYLVLAGRDLDVWLATRWTLSEAVKWARANVTPGRKLTIIGTRAPDGLLAEVSRVRHPKEVFWRDDEVSTRWFADAARHRNNEETERWTSRH